MLVFRNLVHEGEEVAYILSIQWMKVGPSRFRHDLTPALNSFREENTFLSSSLLYRRFFFSFLFFFKYRSFRGDRIIRERNIHQRISRDSLKALIDKKKGYILNWSRKDYRFQWSIEFRLTINEGNRFVDDRFPSKVGSGSMQGRSVWQTFRTEQPAHGVEN